MKHELRFQENITCWEEALPLGNGETGCLIWGKPSHLRFSLDRTDIWDRTPAPGTEKAEFTYGNMVRLAKEGNIARIRELFDAPYNHSLPTKLPAGKIIFRLEGYKNIRSRLRLWDGQAVLELEPESGATGDWGLAHPRIRSLVHATEGVGMISVDMPSERFSVELQAPAFGRKAPGEDVSERIETDSDQASKGSLKSVRYEAPVRERIDCGGGCYLESFRQKVSEDFSYGVVMGVKESGGRTEVFYRVVTSEDDLPGGEEGCPFAEAGERLSALLERGYDRLLKEHTDWWEAFWDRSSLSLPDAFFEKNWYIANYLLASCSREGYYPMPLQGVWTADEDTLPPWKGDYHNDLNTQMSYYHYLKANHLEQGKSFVDFLWNLRGAARAFAKGFYGTGGLCLPSVMSIDGKPLGGWPMYSLSPINQIWLCKAFDDYYRYSGDQRFLRERAYPYFRETAECIGALLEEGEDGLLRFAISSSPELHDDEMEAFVTPNSNYDLAFLHYLYGTLERYAQTLAERRDSAGKADSAGRVLWEKDAVPTEGPERWRHIREKLPQLAVDGRGVLMISPDEVLKESHRHHSHAQAIHPLRLIGYDTTENRHIIDATIEDIESLGTSMWVGFSFCWMAELYAIARKGEEAAGQLRIFWRNFCSPNGFHLNGDQKAEGYSTFTYHPFTLEANMCAADALQEMLLYGEEGVIEAFPAIPKDWEKQRVSFERFRTEGGVLVSAALEDGRLSRLLLEAPREMSVKLKGWRHDGMRDEGEIIEVTLARGENLVITS